MCKRLFVLLTFFVVLGLVIPNVVFADVIEVRVAAGEDDAEEDVATGAIDLTSSDLEITEEGDPVDNQLVGLRFIDIAIPQGVTITSAYVQFQVDETDVPGDNRPGTKFLKGEASDNPVSFTDAAFDISSRPTTSAEASWDWPEWLTEDEEGPDQQTSDISAVIQEIVDRPGWAPGNSLVLIITGSGENAAESFDGEETAAPLLHIEYIIEPTNPGTDGLAAFFALENDVLDSSGNGNDGTIVGAPVFVDGLAGYGMAMEFDGESFVDVGNGASLDITGPISMGMWIRPGADDPEGQGTEAAVMAKADSAASPSWSWQVRYGWNSPQPYMAFTFNTSPRAWAYVGQNLEKDEWAHIACSHDGTTLKCYLNGVETDSTPMGAITSSPAPVLIGSDGWRSDWIGAIDEVAIYDRALSEGEVMYLAGQRVTPVDPGTDGLVAFYALDGDAADSSGNELHGTIAGDPSFVEGPMGMALELDGVDDYVDLGNPAMLDFGTGDFTISAYVNLTTIERATIYAKGGDDGGGIRYTLAMGEGNDNKMTLTTDDDADKRQARGDTVVNDGAWHHVVGIRSGDTSLIYVDGERDGSIDLPEGYDLSGTTQYNALLGAITSNSDGSLIKFFTGLLDEVAIYGRALSAGEIRYLAGFREATLDGLSDVTVVDGAIVSVRDGDTEYVVANGDLILGTTTRWYVLDGVETLWAEGDPAPAETVSDTSTVKGGDVGSRADNFQFILGGTNISSIDGIDFQETVFPSLVDTIILFERGGNDKGTWQAIHADGSLGAAVEFVKASDGGPYADTGVSANGQNAYGVVFKTSVPVQGVRITASGHDTLSISAVP